MPRRSANPPNLPPGTAISRRALLANLAALTLAAACNPGPSRTASATATVPPSSVPTPSPTAAATAAPIAAPATAAPVAAAATAAACKPVPIVAPTAAPYPGYTQIDANGLHVTAEAQIVDQVAFRLQVSGKVDRPLNLSFDDLRCLPKVQADVRVVCPGFFIDNSHYAGVRLADVLAQAAPQAGVNYVELKSADGYSSTVSLTEAQAPENFLAYEWEGQPLPVLHGFPVRAVFPALEGNRWTKWLVAVELK